MNTKENSPKSNRQQEQLPEPPTEMEWQQLLEWVEQHIDGSPATAVRAATKGRERKGGQPKEPSITPPGIPEEKEKT